MLAITGQKAAIITFVNSAYEMCVNSQWSKINQLEANCKGHEFNDRDHIHRHPSLTMNPRFRARGTID
jgi:hypothetical protein